uniref:Uncharacterized protein n=1 Tax=Solanum lycopersicum TaxID=4081 RepID=A0A3Q7HM30_SOLLC
MNTFINNEEFNKKKVIFIMGATRTGKSPEDFCLQAIVYIEKILKTQRVPIIYIKKLVEDPVFMFKYKYNCCFIWIDVEKSVLNRRVDMRVDQMVKAVNEVRQIFIPDADYTKGIRRSIGVPEMDNGDDESKQMILQASISSIKRNTRILICNQLDKIQQLISEKMWSVHDIIATNVFKEDREEDLDEAWTNTILQPCQDIVKLNQIQTSQLKIFVCKLSLNVFQLLLEGQIRILKNLCKILCSCSNISIIVVLFGLMLILNSRVDMRVDQMVKADYTKGIRRSIGVPEMDRYLREETNLDGDDESKQMILQDSISSIKRNTRMVICNQLDKIQRLISEKIWSLHHIIATNAFKENREEDLDEEWTNTVLQPCQDIYDCCFILIDVEQSVLNRRVDMRVDQMVKEGLVDEVRQMFIPDTHYTKGIRRSIGVLEMEKYLSEETNIDGDDVSKQMIRKASYSSIKRNINMFICNQLDKIQRLISEKMWLVYHIIATDVFKEDREEDLDEAWMNTTQRVQIIVGGSNSYIEKLVEDHVFMFKYKYDSCFIWIDVEQSVLNRRVDMRVDQMVKAGLMDEVRQIYIPDANYTKGI